MFLIGALLGASVSAFAQASAWVVPWDQATSDLGCFDEVDPFVYAFDGKNRLLLAYPELLDASTLLKPQGAQVVPTVVNDVLSSGKRTRSAKSPQVLAAVLNTPALAQRHLDELVQAASAVGVDGLELDYERMPDGLWPAFTVLVQHLAAQLHARGKKLSVVVEIGPLYARADAGRKAWAEIARAADELKVMCYYERGEYSDAVGPGNSLAWVEGSARRLLELVPTEKLSIALSLSGTDWALPYPKAASRRRVDRPHYGQVRALLEETRATPSWDESQKAPFFSYERKGKRHLVWYEDERSLAAKVQAVHDAGVRRVALWYLGAKHPELRTSGLCPR